MLHHQLCKVARGAVHCSTGLRAARLGLCLSPCSTPKEAASVVKHEGMFPVLHGTHVTTASTWSAILAGTPT